MKFENSPKNEPWIIYGIQGVDISYVSMLKCAKIIFFLFSSRLFWFLTFDLFAIVQSPGIHLPSSRDRANNINKVFIDSISNTWASNANVIAFDFFMSCNLIDLAIGTNQQKHFNNTNYLIIDIDEWCWIRHFLYQLLSIVLFVLDGVFVSILIVSNSFYFTFKISIWQINLCFKAILTSWFTIHTQFICV